MRDCEPRKCSAIGSRRSINRLPEDTLLTVLVAVIKLGSGPQPFARKAGGVLLLTRTDALEKPPRYQSAIVPSSSTAFVVCGVSGSKG